MFTCLKRVLSLVVTAGLLVALSGPAARAQQPDFSQENWYFGGGISHNDLDNFDNALGVQAFGGLDLPYTFHPQVSNHVELGVMATDDFENDATGAETDHTGVWGAGVMKIHINPRFRALGRLGYDSGDDDGLLAGIGVEYLMARRWMLRGEFVARDNIDSFQANLAYHF